MTLCLAGPACAETQGGGYATCIYDTNVEPINTTYVLPAFEDHGSLVIDIEALWKPYTVIYALGVTPDILSSATATKIAAVTEYIAPPGLDKIVSYLTIMPDGTAKINSMSFVGASLTWTEVLDSLTRFVNEQGTILWEEEWIEK